MAPGINGNGTSGEMFLLYRLPSQHLSMTMKEMWQPSRAQKEHRYNYAHRCLSPLAKDLAHTRFRRR